METPMLNAVVIIAAGASVIKFALFEFEGIAQAWRRIQELQKRKAMPRRRRRGSKRASGL